MRVESGPEESRIVDYDEITQYVDSRYISAPEAYWRLLEYPMHHKSHTIVRLALHLPNQHSIVFHEGDEQIALDSNRDSNLLAFFKLNQEDTYAKTILYQDIPLYWDKDDRKWKKRVHNCSNVIGRIFLSVREMWSANTCVCCF